MRTVKKTIVVVVALAVAAVGAEPSLVPAPRHMKVGNGPAPMKPVVAVLQPLPTAFAKATAR